MHIDFVISSKISMKLFNEYAEYSTCAGRHFCRI